MKAMMEELRKGKKPAPKKAKAKKKEEPKPEAEEVVVKKIVEIED
jgi:hypothetical protein